MPWIDAESSSLLFEEGRLRGLVRQEGSTRRPWIAWRAAERGLLHRLGAAASKEQAQALVEGASNAAPSPE